MKNIQYEGHERIKAGREKSSDYEKEQAAWIQHVVDKIKRRLLGIKPPKGLNHYSVQL